MTLQNKSFLYQAGKRVVILGLIGILIAGLGYFLLFSAVLFAFGLPSLVDTLFVGTVFLPFAAIPVLPMLASVAVLGSFYWGDKKMYLYAGFVFFLIAAVALFLEENAIAAFIMFFGFLCLALDRFLHLEKVALPLGLAISADISSFLVAFLLCRVLFLLLSDSPFFLTPPY